MHSPTLPLPSSSQSPMAKTLSWLSFLSLILFNPARPLNPRASNLAKDVSLTYVKDSGICETVDGVGQYSRYINVGDENYLNELIESGGLNGVKVVVSSLMINE
ncbi:hypothetical protein HHX47_DHR1001019 [Lentinula edodes]|nr:hypothetical protein HHX47_DHR1001019 [Lentinula edodes]